MKKRIFAIVLVIALFMCSTSEVRAQGASQAEAEAYHKEHGPMPELVADCTYEEAVRIGVDYINSTYRTAVGSPALTIDKNLCVIANRRAKEAALIWGHYSYSNANTLFLMCDESNDLYTNCAENLVVTNEFHVAAQGNKYSDQFREAADLYTTSVEGHYETMIEPSFSRCGIGVYYDPTYHYLVFCHLFME